MRITKIGSDLITINEANLRDEKLLEIPRIHLIQLNFESPTEAKIRGVLELFAITNRFIISNNIRIYNAVLKKTNKKFYVSNSVGTKLISFFRKNNKVLLNFNFLSSSEQNFVLNGDIFCDLLENLEVVRMSRSVFNSKREILQQWSGNVIISND